jgi:hypothetical protein
MATTTNFGWETPDDTDLVKDGALAIRTLGSAIDTSLVDLKGGTTGQVLSKTSNTDMDFTWVTSDDANAIQNAIVDAKGDLITATAADTPARLAVGTDGHVLTADSTTATGLKWAAAAGGGKVLQVVSAKYSTSTVIASTTMTDTGLSVTITPSATSSKVLIMVSQQLLVYRASTFIGAGYRLLRGATEIYDGYGTNRVGLYLEASGISSPYLGSSVPIVHLDSPNTTSATTYKIQANVNSAADAGSVTAQYETMDSSIIALEIGA